MKWLEVKIITNREFADVVSLALIEEGSDGTIINDSGDLEELLQSGIIWDYVDESLLSNRDPRVFVSGFFAAEKDITGLIESLNAIRDNATTETGSFEIFTTIIESGEWENEWKKYYMPIEFSSFAIVPEWIVNHDIENKKIILLNPGMAFGTGTHETTSMCLKLMEGIDFEGRIVIDLGCGSGILGITAAALGAAHTILTDIDPCATKCALENVTLNNLNSSVTILNANLLNEQILSDTLKVPPANQEPNGLGVSSSKQEPNGLGVSVSKQEPNGLGVSSSKQEPNGLGVSSSKQEPNGLGVSVSKQEPNGLGVSSSKQEPNGLGVSVSKQEPNGLGVSVSKQEPNVISLASDEQGFESKAVRADVLTANLTAPLLIRAKAGIIRHLNAGAMLVISGILSDYNDEVLAYFKQDFEPLLSLANGAWCAHLLKLRG